MSEFLSSTQAQLVIWMTGLAVLTAIGVFLVKKFRDQNDDDQQDANEMLSNFRDLHDEGDISEREYRNIKTVLGDKLQEEISDNGERGSAPP